MKKANILYIVVPCYNEEDVLKETNDKLIEKIKNLIKHKKISKNSKILYVNDGSKDDTWNIIKELYDNHRFVLGLKLSKNKGHQNALLAGLLFAKQHADFVISIDADLQDDISAIDTMIEKYYAGNDIVYGVRNSRKKDSFFKKSTAILFYKFMKSLGCDIIYNHADFRLTSKRVLEELSKYKEKNLFLRGLFPLIGFNSETVYYERKERAAGESKYSFKKMLNLAWDGITSFSIKPIHFILSVGLLVTIASLIAIIVLIVLLIKHIHISNLYYILVSIWFIGGVQLISLGIIGEYVGKTYSETKDRPRYCIEEELIQKNLQK